MHSPSFEYATPADAREFLETLTYAVLARQPSEAIYAFAEQQGPRVLASLRIGSESEPQQPLTSAQCRAAARAFISRVPRPELRFATREEPHPTPGDPCDCGSGMPYEQCCAALVQRMFPVAAPNPLMLVLPLLPRRQWPELAYSAINPEWVASAAYAMLQERDYTAALALLAPWFEGKNAIPAAHAGLLSALVTVYDAQNLPRKKRQLLDKALKRGDHVIRGIVHQRLAVLAADSGNYASAWAHFEQARREHPADPDLAHLEVMMLLSQGEEEEARARAQFWLDELERQDHPDDSMLRDFLRNVVERGGEAILDLVGATKDAEAALDALCDLLFEEAPAPAACYSLPHATPDSAGELTPNPELADALHLWQREFPQEHPALTMNGVVHHSAFSKPDNWLEILAAHPVLWQSLEVLDDLVLAIDATFDAEQKEDEDILERLLERAQTLLELNLQSNRAENKTLEWAVHGNRPALRLLAQRIYADETKPCSTETLERIEWMLALSPLDNHGMRELAMGAYLQLRQFGKALALSERYPDDGNLPIMFGTILALFATGQIEAAAARFDIVRKFVPKVAPMLLASHPLEPKNDAGRGFVAHGGDYQAWLYRQEYLEVWQQQPGALEWLRAQTV